MDPLGIPLPCLPEGWSHVRDLEYFEGPILTENRSAHGTYVSKLCVREAEEERFLSVRADQTNLARYLAGHISMLELLRSGDGVCTLIDYASEELTRVSIAALDQLPAGYLPSPEAFHDRGLQPIGGSTDQQIFLYGLETDAISAGNAEKNYRDVFAVTFFLGKDAEAEPPIEPFRYNFRRGFPIARFYSRLGSALPQADRPRFRGVHLQSPGVLTLSAPRKHIERTLVVLRSIFEQWSQIREAYSFLQDWAKVDLGSSIDLDEAAQLASVRDLGLMLGLDVDRLIALCDNTLRVAGKLVASHCRRVVRLVGSPYIDVSGSLPPELELALVKAWHDDRAQAERALPPTLGIQTQPLPYQTSLFASDDDD